MRSHVGVARCAFQKMAGFEGVQHDVAPSLVQTPKPLHLLRGEMKARHLEILCLDEPKPVTQILIVVSHRLIHKNALSHVTGLGPIRMPAVLPRGALVARAGKSRDHRFGDRFVILEAHADRIGKRAGVADNAIRSWDSGHLRAMSLNFNAPGLAFPKGQPLVFEGGRMKDSRVNDIGRFMGGVVLGIGVVLAVGGALVILGAALGVIAASALHVMKALP